MSDQVTIALAKIHTRIDEVKEDDILLSKDLAEVERLQGRLQKTMSAVVAESHDTAELTKQILENSQNVNARLSAMEAKFQSQSMALWVVLAFTVGGITIPLIYALISAIK